MENDTPLALSESFLSIQGESSYAGYPCFFFRLSGCNLRCSYCDARYACEEPGRLVTVGELLTEAAEHPTSLIEITGGEPLLQEGVYPLIEALLQKGRTVLLETNGSLALDRVPAEAVKILDLKCPASGMHREMLLTNLDLLQAHDEVKFVLSDRTDYEWAREIIRAHRLEERTKLLLSPVRTRLDPASLAEWLLADGLKARLQLQLHTLLWPERTRGA